MPNVPSETPFVPDMRNREWPLWIEATARHGLTEEDSVGEVVFELAKWLLWVDLYGRDDRVERTVELLRGFVASKHNGFVTRVNGGRIDELLGQVERIVRGALDQPAGSKELFCRIRQKRDGGSYRRMIEVAPILGTASPDGRHDGEYNCTTYSVSIPIVSDAPVPQEIESRIADFARANRMQVRDGVYPIVRFARRLLNHLWAHHGSARLHRDVLAGWAGGVNQQNKFKKTLCDLGVIDGWQGTYRSKAASSLYRMSPSTRSAFEGRVRDTEQRRVV